MGSHSADTSLCGISRFPGKNGLDQPRDQFLRFYCHPSLLVSPPSFENILSNAGRDLKIRMITYLQRNCIKIRWISRNKYEGYRFYLISITLSKMNFYEFIMNFYEFKLSGVVCSIIRTC